MSHLNREKKMNYSIRNYSEYRNYLRDLYFQKNEKLQAMMETTIPEAELLRVIAGQWDLSGWQVMEICRCLGLTIAETELFRAMVRMNTAKNIQDSFSAYLLMEAMVVTQSLRSCAA
jgi:hypothetical protein